MGPGGAHGRAHDGGCYLSGLVIFLFKASGRLMVLGRVYLVFKIFLPKSDNSFEAGFSGFGVGGFLHASPGQKNYQLRPSKSWA